MPPGSYAPADIYRKDPRVSPLYADLSGIPPMLIQVGFAEGLLDDATRFAGAAGAADVAYDPRMASLECPSGAGPRGASKRGRVHPPKSQAA